MKNQDTDRDQAVAGKAGAGLCSEASASETSKCPIKRMRENKALAWGMVAVWMGVIFAFSAQAHSGEMTEKYLGGFNISVRKGAHMFEYATLFILTCRALRRTGNWRFSPAVSALVFCVLYAMSDEFHQSFVPGRSATASDVMVDSGGCLLGCLFYFQVWSRWLGSAVLKPRNPGGELPLQ